MKIIREEKQIELIVFPVPVLCDYLTSETKRKVFMTTEKDEQNSKITGFFEQVDTMWDEMKWQKRLRQRAWLYWLNSNISLWGNISFNLAVLINLLIVFFYPFSDQINSSLRRNQFTLNINKSFYLIIQFSLSKKSILNGISPSGSVSLRQLCSSNVFPIKIPYEFLWLFPFFVLNTH